MSERASREYSGREMPALPNGVRVLFDPMPYVHSVSVSVSIGAGSANEDAQQAGVSHFLEHLFFKGTSARSAHKLMEEIEGRGGHLNAYTTRDYMCLYVRVLEEHCAKAIEILADIIKNSQFPDFEKERNVVLEEIASAADVPEEFAHDLLLLHLWPDHPLGRPVMGSCETIAALQLEDARRHYERWCRPRNMIFSIAGNFSESAVYDQVYRELGGLPDGSAPARCGPPAFRQGLCFTQRDIGQSHLCMGFPGPSMTDEGRYVGEMLASILGGGSTSRLFERIREQEGLAYSIYAFRSGYHVSGHMGVYAAVAPENLGRSLELVCEEIRRLRETPVSEEEILLNREQIKGAILLALESSSNRASHMAKSVIYHDRILSPEEIVAGIETVTAEDILQFARNTFTADQTIAVVLGPQEGFSRVSISL